MRADSAYLARTTRVHRRELSRCGSPNYVGGDWRAVEGVETLDDVDPATGEVAALVPLSGAAEVRAAAEAARAAQPAWRAVPPQQRARAVLALRDGAAARAARS